MNWVLILQYFKIRKLTYMTQKTAHFEYLTRVYSSDMSLINMILPTSGEEGVFVNFHRMHYDGLMDVARYKGNTSITFMR